MPNIHIAALHDRVDEEHFELRLHASAITALQQRVIVLEAAVRELRTDAFGGEARDVVQRNPDSKVPPLRQAHARPGGRAHAGRLA